MERVRRKTAAGLLALVMILHGWGYALAAEEESPAPIGQEEGALYALTIENGTERDITAVALKGAEDEDFADNLLAEGDVFEAGQVRTVYIPGEEPEEGEEAPMCDIRFIAEDTDIYVLHGMPIGGVETYTLLLSEDGVAYVSYEDEQGEAADTLEAEQAVRQAEEEAAAAAAAAEAAAQQSTQTTTTTTNSDGCLSDALFW